MKCGTSKSRTCAVWNIAEVPDLGLETLDRQRVILPGRVGTDVVARQTVVVDNRSEQSILGARYDVVTGRYRRTENR